MIAAPLTINWQVRARSNAVRTSHIFCPLPAQRGPTALAILIASAAASPALAQSNAQSGAEAIVLACTELELVVDTDANVLPVYDSTDIHCRAAADWILG